MVTTDQECPAASTVEARVRETLGLAKTTALRERAAIGRTGPSLRVTLRAEDGRILGDRVLRAEGSCDELAGVAAVILATWISDVHPEFVGSLPEAPKAPTADNGPPAAPVRPNDSHASRRWSFGVAAGVDLSSIQVAPLVSLGARWLPARSGWGGFVTATLTGPHDQDLGEGQVHYWRWPLAMGLALRVPVSSTRFDFQAGPALAWLRASGQSLAQPETRNQALGGIFAATRASALWGKLEPFAEISVIGWPAVSPYLRITNRDISLPRVEVYLVVGASLGGR